MHGSCRSRWMVQNHAPCSFRTSEKSSRCPQSVVSITIMSDGRYEIRSARRLVPGEPGTPGTPEAGPHLEVRNPEEHRACLSPLS
jgi:hypothetical protein